MQRVGLGLVLLGLALVLGVVLHLLSGGIDARAVAPFLPAAITAGAGALLVAGMALIERHREPDAVLEAAHTRR